MEALLPTEIIKAEALRLGFSACGAAPAEAVSEKVADTFRQWLADGCQGEMAYMQNYEDQAPRPAALSRRGTHRYQCCPELLSRNEAAGE